MSPGRLAWQHVGGAEGLFEDLAALLGAYKALVGPLVPADARLLPVAPQAVGLDRRHHAVDDAGEDGPALVRDHGLKRERRDGAQQRLIGLLADAPSALKEWVATASALDQNRCEGSTAGLPATTQSRSSSSEASRETA